MLAVSGCGDGSCAGQVAKGGECTSPGGALSMKEERASVRDMSAVGLHSTAIVRRKGEVAGARRGRRSQVGSNGGAGASSLCCTRA